MVRAAENAMSKAALERYQARMQRALDHIDQHLESELGLAALTLADVELDGLGLALGLGTWAVPD